MLKKGNGFLKLIVGAAILSVMGLAVYARLWNLSNKPIHHDEAVNGWLVAQAWSQGFADYNPTNFHGVALFYFFQIAEWIGGIDIFNYRLVTALFGLGIVVLLAHWGRKEWNGNYLPALIVLISPAFIFFGRSAIHETPFVFFQLGFLLWFWRGIRDQSEKDFWLSSICLVMAILLKETFALLVVIVLLVGGVEFWLRGNSNRFQVAWKKMLRPVVGGIALLVFLQSGFLQNFSDLIDLFTAFLPWFKTGVDQAGHAKPLEHWIKLIFQNEPVFFVSFAIAGVSIFSKNQTLRMSSWVSLGLFFIYSFIPYKTEWCLVTILFPFAIVVGEWWQNQKSEKTKFGFLVLIAVLGIYQSLSIPVLLSSDFKNSTHPYFYVETSTQLRRVIAQIHEREKQDPHFFKERVIWNARELWPLPWVMSRYESTMKSGALDHNDLEAGILFFELENLNAVTAALSESHDLNVVDLRADGPQMGVAIRKINVKKDEK